MSMSPSTVPVQIPRELVLASAGTGKTFRISSRIIGLLAAGGHPDAIFASTFTRKAAGEILDRVLIRLAAAALGEDCARELSEAALFDKSSAGPEFWRRLLERLVSELHRVNIGTLDSFFVRAVTSFADEVGLPPGWRIADEAVAARVREEALREVLDQADRGVLLELLRGLANGGARRSVHDAVLTDLRELVELHHALDGAAADCWRGFSEYAGDLPANFDELRLALADEFESTPPPLTNGGTPRVNWAKNLAAAGTALRMGDWDSLLNLKLGQRAREDEGTFDRVAIPIDVAELFASADVLARAVLARRLTEQCRTMGRLTALFASALDRRQRETGAFGFAELTRLLGGGSPLCERPDIFYRLDARTQHIFLDEFQDTSLAQWQALEPLVDELLSGYEGERAAVVVADPKQSIYAWRGGEPALVSHVGEQYNLTREELSTSWRSSQVVLDLVNRVFTGLAESDVFEGDNVSQHAAADWSLAFQEHRAAKDLPGFVQVIVGPEDEKPRGPRPRLMARAAEMAAAMHRGMPGATIGILTRKNATVARIMLEMRRLGVPASEEGGNPLTDSAAVASVLALFRLADHPGDSLARYHVANTPVGSAVAFTDYTDSAAATRLSHSFRQRLVEDGYGSTVAWLARELQADCDARERRRLSQLVELAFRFDPDATLRATDFVGRVEVERVEDPTTAAIRVMTVHQAKGLEFDAVILPELDEPLTRGSLKPFAYRPTPTDPVARIFPYVPQHVRPLFDEVPELSAAMAQAEAAQLRDALSAFYVAMTRARHAVHILVKPDGARGMGKSKTPARLLRAAIGAGDPAGEGDVLLAAGDPRWFEAHEGRHTEAERPREAGAQSISGTPPVLLRKASRRSRALPRVRPSDLAGGPMVDLRSLLRLEFAGAERGTITHAWFERVGWIEDGLPSDDELRIIAREHGHLPDDDLDSLISDFKAAAAVPEIARALSRSEYGEGATVEHETPFVYRDDDRLIEGVIDRLVLSYEQGVVTRADILDYKTDRIPAGDVAELAKRSTYYAPQLEMYRCAVATLWNLPPHAVSARFLFLAPGRVVEAPATGPLRAVADTSS